jgi:hypothetical protein
MFIPTYKAEGQAVIQVGVSNLLSAGDKTIKGVIGNEDSSTLYQNVSQSWNIANQGEKELLTFGLSVIGGKVVYSGIGSLGKVKNITGTLRQNYKKPTKFDGKAVSFNTRDEARKFGGNIKIQQIANNFFKKASQLKMEGNIPKYSNFKVTTMKNKHIVMEHTAKSDTKGYTKRTVKVVDHNGKVTRHFKETIKPNGIVKETKIIVGK